MKQEGAAAAAAGGVVVGEIEGAWDGEGVVVSTTIVVSSIISVSGISTLSNTLRNDDEGVKDGDSDGDVDEVANGASVVVVVESSTNIASSMSSVLNASTQLDTSMLNLVGEEVG